MISAIDRIVIEVPNLEQAAAEYALLLGEVPRGQSRVLLPLSNVTLELVPGALDAEPVIRGICFYDDGLEDNVVQRIPTAAEHLKLQRVGSLMSRRQQNTMTGISSVDHIVLMTADADRCLRTFGPPGLGLPLLLDQDKPQWGGRMLFFRSGKLTLEVVHPHEEPPELDYFWGIAYHCEDLEQTLEILTERGVKHSPSREGRKPGTRVALVESHALGLPTLLIENVG